MRRLPRLAANVTVILLLTVTVNTYEREVEDLALAILKGAPPKLGPNEGLLNARILDRLVEEIRK